MLVATSAIVGFKFAMMTKLTGSLYMSMGDHFVNNTIVNILHAMSTTGADEGMVLRVAIAQSVSFFAGFTLSQNRGLKSLLMIHGLFFFSCMLGVFSTEANPFIGVVVLEIWCIYFVPVGFLSYCFFKDLL